MFLRCCFLSSAIAPILAGPASGALGLAAQLERDLNLRDQNQAMKGKDHDE